MITATYRLLALVGTFALSLPLTASAKESCANDVCFPTEKQVGDVTLPLRGAGLSTWYGFWVCSGALHAPAEPKSFDELIGTEGVALNITLHYHREISKQKLFDSTKELMADQPGYKESNFTKEWAQIEKLFRTVQEGDEFQIRLLSDGRLVHLFNNKQLATEITNPEFIRRFIGVWLGDQPINKTWRDQMLGIKASDYEI